MQEAPSWGKCWGTNGPSQQGLPSADLGSKSILCTMPSSKKTWSDFTPKYRRELAHGVAANIMDKASSIDEAAIFLRKVVERIEEQTGKTLPPLQVEKPENIPAQLTEEQGAALVKSLGTLRATHASHNSQLHLPKISVADMDKAIVFASLPLQVLQGLNYDIGRAQHRKVQSENLTGSSRVGRKSKVQDDALVNTVGKLLQKYANDSSKVVCIRDNGRKTLVCAKVLSKKVWQIWKAEPDVRAQMSWSTFLKITRARFPQFRKPSRKTDVCSHCRTLKRHIAPRAFKEYKKRRQGIEQHCPEYFSTLDAAPDFATLVQTDKVEDIVLQTHRFISLRNSNASSDPARSGLSRTARFDLFSAEARALHKLRGHCDLLRAYQWHRTTSNRQKASAQRILDHLRDTEAYMHFDFKENVRYPMSKEETGDEWHAQNKLSLTVFGCNVHTPGRKDMNFLLVSEVLDHDSQMARMLVTKILEIVQSKAAYQWSQVKTLHLVCDCGPHFRSREGYAFFLHDLPKIWNVNATFPAIVIYSGPLVSFLPTTNCNQTSK